MTLSYNEMNPTDALYLAARKYPGGIDALASRMGMQPSVLYKKLCTKVERNFVNYEEVSAILDFLTEAGQKKMVELVINSFCYRHDFSAVELPTNFTVEGSLPDSIYELIRHQFELTAHLHESIKDNYINEQEYQKLDRGVMQCVLDLLKLRKKIHVKHMERL